VNLNVPLEAGAAQEASAVSTSTETSSEGRNGDAGMQITVLSSSETLNEQA
jgi:hypothetical protein